AEHVRQYVDATAMRHRHRDFACAAECGKRDDLIQHHHQRVAPFYRETLVALVRASQETLERIDFGKPREGCLFLIDGEILVIGPALDGITQPLTLLEGAEMLELEASRRRIQRAQTRGGGGCRSVRHSHDATWNRCEQGLRHTVTLGAQLR